MKEKTNKTNSLNSNKPLYECILIRNTTTGLPLSSSSANFQIFVILYGNIFNNKIIITIYILDYQFAYLTFVFRNTILYLYLYLDTHMFCFQNRFIHIYQHTSVDKIYTIVFYCLIYICLFDVDIYTFVYRCFV